MNCCGQKRQSLQYTSATDTSATDTSVHETETKDNLTTIDQRPVYFQYTGNGELQVKGLFDIIYTFSAQRRQLLVHAEDVSIMRGYDNLAEV